MIPDIDSTYFEAGTVSGRMYCTTCGAVADPKRITSGAIWIELVLWLFFFVPGLIYSIWRLTSRYDGCAVCGRNSIIPVESPMAKKLIGR